MALITRGSIDAPPDAQYVTLGLHADLTAERILTGTANQVIVTDGGAGLAVTLSCPQDIDTGATPQFANLGLGQAANATRLSFLAATAAAGGIDFGGDVTLYRSAANVLKTDDTLHVAADLDVAQHGAFGLWASPSTARILALQDQTVIRTGTAEGLYVYESFEPSGSLTGTVHIYGVDSRAYFATTQDSETTDAFITAVRGYGRTLNADATGNLHLLEGIDGVVMHFGAGTIGEARGVSSYIDNADDYSEDGDITVAYNFIAEARTDKSTGIVAARYGLRINDVIGGGLLTNQYGIYIELLDAAGTNNYAIKTLGGRINLDQSVDNAAIPVVELDQADVSEGFIDFLGSARGAIAGATNSTESVRVELNGTIYRLALYVDA